MLPIISNIISKIICVMSIDNPVPTCTGLKNLFKKLNTGEKILEKKLNIPLYL